MRVSQNRPINTILISIVTKVLNFLDPEIRKQHSTDKNKYSFTTLLTGGASHSDRVQAVPRVFGGAKLLGEFVQIISVGPSGVDGSQYI